LVYNPEDKSLSEVAEHTGVQRKIDNEKLQSSLIDDDYVQVVETKNLNMYLESNFFII
jgi:hypothetical protein